MFPCGTRDHPAFCFLTMGVAAGGFCLAVRGGDRVTGGVMLPLYGRAVIVDQFFSIFIAQIEGPGEQGTVIARTNDGRVIYRGRPWVCQ